MNTQKHAKKVINVTAQKVTGREHHQQDKSGWSDGNVHKQHRERILNTYNYKIRGKNKWKRNIDKRSSGEEKKLQEESVKLKLQKLENESIKFYRKLNNSRKDFMPRLTTCRNKHRHILKDGNYILESWAENFEERLNTGGNMSNYQLVADSEDNKEIATVPRVEEI